MKACSICKTKFKQKRKYCNLACGCFMFIPHTSLLPLNGGHIYGSRKKCVKFSHSLSNLSFSQQSHSTVRPGENSLHFKRSTGLSGRTLARKILMSLLTMVTPLNSAVAGIKQRLATASRILFMVSFALLASTGAQLASSAGFRYTNAIRKCLTTEHMGPPELIRRTCMNRIKLSPKRRPELRAKLQPKVRAKLRQKHGGVQGGGGQRACSAHSELKPGLLFIFSKAARRYSQCRCCNYTWHCPQYFIEL